ncbi:transcriptional regulator [Christensenellaceae bacterium]|nr:transcriptional regulator [Christensenellaceae bacterium]BDF61489.1 transcriptional regulator [Christensenellaceae bacterium]
MAVCFNKLWKLLIDCQLRKKDLIEMSGISWSSIAKLGRNENVNFDLLVKICNALNCDFGDILKNKM